MFFKLSLRNARRSFRDYGVYLLTLTFGVCLFYTFSSIEGQGAMAYLARTQNPMTQAILTLVNIFSVFVAVVLACLILYADRFLLRRRKRELGTYLLLGLSQGQVSRLLFLETGIVGLLSLAAGLLLGVAASFGLSALTLSLFQLDFSGLLALTFSWPAAGKTAGYFALIFLLAMLLSGLEVSRSKLTDLMQGARKNEPLGRQSLGRSVLLLCAGVLCLLAAYAILLFFGMALAVGIPFLCVPMLALGTLGTLLLFRSLSGLVMHYARTHPKFYYKGLNMFTLRQWTSRLHTACLSQTVICILLLLAIGITSSAAGLNSAITDLAQEPCDVSITNYDADTAPVDLAARLAGAGFDPEKEFSAWHMASFYYPTTELGEALNVNALLCLSDYNALMALQGGSPLSPADLPTVTGERLVAGGTRLSCAVVDDETVRGLPLRRQVLAANYAGDAEETETRLTAVLNQPSFSQGFGLRFDSRLITYADTLGSKVLVLFLGLYLGITFLLSSAAVLALQQLSQAADNTARYTLLARLGVERSMADRSVFAQVALAFLLPLALALVHSAVGMTATNDLIAQAGKVDAWAGTLTAAVLLTAVYGAYFLATCLGCRRIAAGR